VTDELQPAADAILAALPAPEPEPVSFFTLVENCRYGRFLVTTHDAYVGKALQKYGEYSQVELDLLLQFITPQTRVVSVGANIGAMIVPFAKKAGQVVCFEPQRWVYQLCVANCVLNDLINVRAYWAGCGARPGRVTVPILDPAVDNNFGALELASVQQMEGDEVPIYAIDRLIDMDMGLLQIDVEGMELDVLQGAEATIERCRPVIFFEADRALKRGAVFDWLRKHNYDLYWYTTPLYNPNNWRQDPENIYQTKDGAIIVAENCIAVPRERGIVMNGFKPVLEI
jgi:FkbM family methyltransferase